MLNAATYMYDNVKYIKLFVYIRSRICILFKSL